MKKIFFILLICIFSEEAFSQSSIPSEVRLYANAAGRKLKSCCSSWGGKDLSISIESWDVNSVTARITITMTTSWTGSMSGSKYWIKGKLICDVDGCNPSWTKIEDSQLLPMGCGRDCITKCLE